VKLLLHDSPPHLITAAIYLLKQNAVYTVTQQHNNKQPYKK